MCKNKDKIKIGQYHIIIYLRLAIKPMEKSLRSTPRDCPGWWFDASRERKGVPLPNVPGVPGARAIPSGFLWNGSSLGAYFRSCQTEEVGDFIITRYYISYSARKSSRSDVGWYMICTWYSTPQDLDRADIFRLG